LLRILSLGLSFSGMGAAELAFFSSNMLYWIFAFIEKIDRPEENGEFSFGKNNYQKQA
jgi:hypothetical protein